MSGWIYLLWWQLCRYWGHSCHRSLEQGGDHSLSCHHPVSVSSVNRVLSEGNLSWIPVARGEELHSQSWRQSRCPWWPYPQSKTQNFSQNQNFLLHYKFFVNLWLTLTNSWIFFNKWSFWSPYIIIIKIDISILLYVCSFSFCRKWFKILYIISSFKLSKI